MESSNFRPLASRWPELYEHVTSAERYAYTDPHTAAVKLRCFAEMLVGRIYSDLELESEAGDGFFERLKSPTFQNLVDPTILQKLHAFRMLGNKAAHGEVIRLETSLFLLEEAYQVGRWLCETYGINIPGGYPAYVQPRPPATQEQSTEDLARQLAEAQAELARVAAASSLNASKIVAPDPERIEEFKHRASQAASFIEPGDAQARRQIGLRDAFAGFELNEGQSELVDRLGAFLDGTAESVFLLKGYAGTGKTFITKGLTEYFRAIGRNYVLAAPTGKASKVIAAKTLSPAYTIHKTIYSFHDIAEYRDNDEEGTETFKFYARLRVNEQSADTVYIVDEASMVADIYQEAEFFRFGTGFLLTDFLKFVNLGLR